MPAMIIRNSAIANATTPATILSFSSLSFRLASISFNDSDILGTSGLSYVRLIHTRLLAALCRLCRSACCGSAHRGAHRHARRRSVVYLDRRQIIWILIVLVVYGLQVWVLGLSGSNGSQSGSNSLTVSMSSLISPISPFNGAPSIGTSGITGSIGSSFHRFLQYSRVLRIILREIFYYVVSNLTAINNVLIHTLIRSPKLIHISGVSTHQRVIIR